MSGLDNLITKLLKRRDVANASMVVLVVYRGLCIVLTSNMIGLKLVCW